MHHARRVSDIEVEDYRPIRNEHAWLAAKMKRTVLLLQLASSHAMHVVKKKKMDTVRTKE